MERQNPNHLLESFSSDEDGAKAKKG